MEKPTFKIGDLVKHRTGDQKMVVTIIDETNKKVGCEFMNHRDGALMAYWIDAVALEPWVEEPSIFDVEAPPPNGVVSMMHAPKIAFFGDNK